MSTTEPIRPLPGRKILSAHARLFGTGELTPLARCLVIVAHPADEIVGAGCLISKLVDVRVVHVTDGAPAHLNETQAAGFSDREEYAEARRLECLAALALANVSPEQVVEFGIEYQRAAYCLTELTRKITNLLERSPTDIVVTHPYEGGHPDHDATAFATHAAVRLLRRDGYRSPIVFEMALRPGKDGMAKLPEFLPGSENETTTLLLNERARRLKQRMFDCFETQRESLQLSPAGPERFRPSLEQDFSLLPQPGELHYERLECGITAEEWHSLAREALHELFPKHVSTSDG